MCVFECSPHLRARLHYLSIMRCSFNVEQLTQSKPTALLALQVKFSPDQKKITSMASMATEVVELGSVQVTDSIETWLSSLAQ